MKSQHKWCRFPLKCSIFARMVYVIGLCVFPRAGLLARWYIFNSRMLCSQVWRTLYKSSTILPSFWALVTLFMDFLLFCLWNLTRIWSNKYIGTKSSNSDLQCARNWCLKDGHDQFISQQLSWRDLIWIFGILDIILKLYGTVFIVAGKGDGSRAHGAEIWPFTVTLCTSLLRIGNSLCHVI